MSAAPRIGVPPLAGVSSLKAAARIGFSVDVNVARLLRYQWVERRLMRIFHARLTATPEWEVKGAFALHQWLCAEHADMLRRRISEMRQPAPRLDAPPDDALESFLSEIEWSATTVDLLAGIYGVALDALAKAYRDHLACANPLVDQPTVRVLRFALLETEESLAWGNAALSAFAAPDPVRAAQAEHWRQHLRAYLGAAGGLAGDRSRTAVSVLPRPRARGAYVPDLHPQRDARFHGRYNFNYPPHVVYNMPHIPADERNLALLCKRILEMDVPEMMASFLYERADRPWEFYHDYARQLWDEARHSMLGEAAFEARGVDWTRIPLNVGFALRLNLHAAPDERQKVLYGIEQGLMPADTGKRFEHMTATEAGDALSAHFHDYDWADEVLHAQIGRRWMREEGLNSTEAVEEAERIWERTWAELERYRSLEPQENWWPDFVRTVLGKESAVRAEDLVDPKMMAE
jgi:hypothetical protein